MGVAGMAMHHTERFNRLATYLASYKLAMEGGARSKGLQISDDDFARYQKDDPKLAEAVASGKLTKQQFEAALYANKITLDSHVDYSRENAPKLLRGDNLTSKLMYQFQKYQIGMMQVLGRNATDMFDKTLDKDQRFVAGKTLAGILGTHATMCGAMGLPGFGLAAFVLNMNHKLLGNKDQPFDAEDSFRRLATQAFGRDFGDVISRGILYAPGVKNIAPADITDRLGMGDMASPSNSVGTFDRQNMLQYLGSTLTGPAGSMLGNLAEAYKLANQGDTWKATEQVLPKVFRDAAKLSRFYQEGITTESGNTVVSADELRSNPLNLAVAALGFQPQLEESDYANRSALQGAKAEMDDRRKALIHEYTQAMVKGDQDGVSSAQAAVQRFNQARMADGAYSELLKPTELTRSVMNRRVDDIRLRDGVSISPKQRGLMAYGLEDDTGQ
jgi:hypothetical protein